MVQKSLGLIEATGLLTAIEAADSAVKSANVELVGYEFAKGGGMTVIKLYGEIGAINAAVSAARVSAAKVGQIVSTSIIARPADGVEAMVINADTVGVNLPKPPHDTPPDATPSGDGGGKDTKPDDQSDQPPEPSPQEAGSGDTEKLVAVELKPEQVEADNVVSVQQLKTEEQSSAEAQPVDPSKTVHKSARSRRRRG
ncbi:BMC domain-containing protein [Cohaesibacter celericrescens]|uniref:BMC domain-containing protein n=1 Tax=Cohaesibacter celericrescens TaxID=2067669 RepID=A0A2N5XQX1_9HYPH|nr:BMC domain-containing protein [Cohaesibacter celericrescens]PLW76840.1 hypothetical protein C0081_12335 [Cohaesibacter celericrescens]